MPERAIQEMKNHLNSWREKFVHALFRHTCTLIACRNGEEKKQDVLQDVKLKQIFTLTKTVTILFVHERGNSVHASRGYAARSVPEFPRSWTNNIVTITCCSFWKAVWMHARDKTASKHRHIVSPPILLNLLEGWKHFFNKYSFYIIFCNFSKWKIFWFFSKTILNEGGKDIFKK